MDERGPTGDEGLDRILGGGLPLNGINLIMGRPGSGKTILCQQSMFARATEERPAVYLSTVSEPFEKILRYAQTLSFFDRSAIGRSIFYEDLGPDVAGEGGLTAVTIEAIANKAGVSRPTIYRYWPNAPAVAMAAFLEASGAPAASKSGRSPLAALRAQLSALATVVSSLDARRPPDGPARAELEQRLDAAIETADEAAVIAAATSLARSDRAAVQSVDWSAVSGG